MTIVVFSEEDSVMYFKYFGKTLSWSYLRPYLLILATTLSYHSMWRLPRAAQEWGGASYALAVTLALAAVGLPAVLLQLAMGQLSQQDPVGVWKAVPFFKGVGYLRLLISFICAIYNAVYLALSAAYFLYTLGRSLPFQECYVNDNQTYKSTNATTCLRTTFLAPVTKKPEYYIALTLIIIVTWSSIPFMLYSPVKFLKRLLLWLAPAALLLAVVVALGCGDSSGLARLRWGPSQHFLRPRIWHSAVVQAFLATHTAGGFLIAASDPIYSSINLKTAALIFISSNIAATWLSLLFWYSVGGPPPPPGAAPAPAATPVAVLTQIYDAAVDRDLFEIWPLMMYAMLVCLGILTMLCLLFPIYERCRRGGGLRWRQLCVGASLVGAGGAQAALGGGLPALHVLEDLVAPFLITITTTAEILIFFFVYGRKYIVEDIEFLTGRSFSRFWSYTFCVVPILVLPLWVWWVVATSLGADCWLSQNHTRLTLMLCFLVLLGTVVAFALVAVAKQDREDKRVKMSLQPSKDWGPCDPVTHHYWLESKLGSQRGEDSAGSGGSSDGQLTISHSDGSSEESTSETVTPEQTTVVFHNLGTSNFSKGSLKARCNSYDWVYTANRQRLAGKPQPIERDVRRTHSCDFSTSWRLGAGAGDWDRMGAGADDWGRDSYTSYDCSLSIARLSDNLQKLHSIPQARQSHRRYSAQINI